MPRISLVNPPLLARGREHLTPPLGLLCLAEIAELAGWNWALVDLDLQIQSWDSKPNNEFYEQAASRILADDPDICALTSMGVNTHVALEIANRVKQASPRTFIAAGGVHFSSIHAALLQMGSPVDCFVVGEGEIAFRQMLNLFAGHSGIDSIPPRLAGDGDTVTLNAEQPGDFGFPFKAIERIDLEEYFRESGLRRVSYEGGRGCVFKCAFCYSPGFYGGGARDLRPAQIVSNWERLHSVGVNRVFMVQDNFTNHPRLAIQICHALEASELPISWNAYGTLPQLSPVLIAALGRARCEQLYIGVDAVSANQQKAFDKPFFKHLAPLLATIGRLCDAGVQPTCAFILNLFTPQMEEVEATLRTAIACAGAGARIRINALSRYPGTSLDETMASSSRGEISRYSEARARILLEVPEVVCQNDLAKLNPELYPFHSTEATEVQWIQRLRMIRLAQRMIQIYPDDFASLAKDVKNNVSAVFSDLVTSDYGIEIERTVGLAEIY